MISDTELQGDHEVIYRAILPIATEHRFNAECKRDFSKFSCIQIMDSSLILRCEEWKSPSSRRWPRFALNTRKSLSKQ